MKRIEFEIVLKLQGPVMTQSSAAGEFGLDAPIARDAQNRLCIPGSLVKGRLRQACEELNPLVVEEERFPVDTWFGKVSGNQKNEGENVLPLRGALSISNFVAEEAEKSGCATIHRVRMNPDTGTVDKGAYLVIEAPVAPGQEIEFKGIISLISNENSEAIRQKIERALSWVTSLGGERTVGFGRLVGVTVLCKNKVSEPNENHRITSETTKLHLTLTPAGPFCIANKKLDGNVFISEQIIPGGVIKGGIATTWGLMTGQGANAIVNDVFDPARKELCKNFSAIRITHAFPAQIGKARPIVAPLSVVKAGDTFFDVALLETPVLISQQAPTFDIDWKGEDFGQVNKTYGWPVIGRQLQVRTAMNRATRSAEKEQLFAYESVEPADNHWHASIDLTAVPSGERQATAEQLQEILDNGLSGWSKTKSSASVCLSAAVAGKYSELFSINGVCVVTLQTPAILCEPKKLNEVSAAIDLRLAYQKALDELSDSCIELVRYFARQEMMGGYYLHQRFQRGKPYHPWLLTTAGSVFVLRPIPGREADAEKCLATWAEQGLPLPQWAKDEYAGTGESGDHWQNCPYIRENGFGEIAVNLDSHFKNQPKEFTEVGNVL